MRDLLLWAGMHATGLTRAVARPRLRLAVIAFVSGAFGAVAATGAVMALRVPSSAADTEPRVQVVEVPVAPVIIDLSSLAAPEPAPAPEPASVTIDVFEDVGDAFEEPRPAYVAGTPQVWSGCERDVETECPSAFPAISEDGSTMAIAEWDDTPADWPGMTIHFVRTRDSRVIESHRLFETMEYQSDETIRQRGLDAQERLDAGNYHALTLLGLRGTRFSHPTLRTEVRDDYVLVTERDSSWPRYHEQFDVVAAFGEPPTGDDEDPDQWCHPTSVLYSSVWLDPTSDALLVMVNYGVGSCMCGSSTRYYARTLGPALTSGDGAR